MILKNFLITLAAAALIALTGCRAPRDITYMQGWQNGEIHEMIDLNSIKAQPDDKLSISVNAEKPLLSESLNLVNFSHRLGQPNYNNGNGNQPLVQGQNVSYYTVDPNGDIDFPLVGTIHVEGLTRAEIAETVKQNIVSKELATNPVVIVAWANVGVTIAGEVAKPGRYQLTRDVTTLPEALGLAGDLTIHGKRDNILVVRTVDGKTTSYRVDLTDGDALQNSPVYVLRQNDYIYIEPNNMRKRMATVNGNNVLQASFWVSIASLLTSIAVLVFK